MHHSRKLGPIALLLECTLIILHNHIQTLQVPWSDMMQSVYHLTGICIRYAIAQISVLYTEMDIRWSIIWRKKPQPFPTRCACGVMAQRIAGRYSSILYMSTQAPDIAVTKVNTERHASWQLICLTISYYMKNTTMKYNTFKLTTAKGISKFAWLCCLPVLLNVEVVFFHFSRGDL